MAMSNYGLVKLIEECGELVQVAGKKIAYPVGEHPDGNGPLLNRLEDEIADVVAAISFVIAKLNLDSQKIFARKTHKLAAFEQWDLEGP